jgi:hypothetical protein
MLINMMCMVIVSLLRDGFIEMAAMNIRSCPRAIRSMQSSYIEFTILE